MFQVLLCVFLLQHVVAFNLLSGPLSRILHSKTASTALITDWVNIIETCNNGTEIQYIEKLINLQSGIKSENDLRGCWEVKKILTAGGVI